MGYALAIPAGFVLAAIASTVVQYIPFFFAAVFLGPVGGELIGKAMSYCTGWKRGPRLAAVAAATLASGGVSAPFLLLLLRGDLNLLMFRLDWALDPLRTVVRMELEPLIFSILAASTAYWRIR